MKVCYIIFCLLVCVRCAAQDSTGIYINQVLRGEGRSLAINRLVALRQPVSFPLLEAISNSSLYTWKDKAVTLGNKAMVYEVYPNSDGQPLMLPVSDVDPVEIGRADRLLLSPITAWINIFNPDGQKRMLAYGQLPDTASAADMGILRLALRTEANPGTRRAGQESYYSIQLNRTPDNTIARAYIDSLYANEGDNATRILRSYAKRNDRPEAISSYALQKAQALDEHYSWLQRIQNLFSGVSLGSILILISLGLSIVYGLAGIINMAHGEFLMIGAYTTYCMEGLFTNTFHVHSGNWFYLTALPVSFVVAGGSGVAPLKAGVRRRLSSAPPSIQSTS